MRPDRSAWPWARALPASLTHDQVRDLHALSRRTGRPIRRIVTAAVTDAVTAALDEAREGEVRAA
jgi:hypothetical protein